VLQPLESGWRRRSSERDELDASMLEAATAEEHLPLSRADAAAAANTGVAATALGGKRFRKAHAPPRRHAGGVALKEETVHTGEDVRDDEQHEYNEQVLADTEALFEEASWRAPQRGGVGRKRS